MARADHPIVVKRRQFFSDVAPSLVTSCVGPLPRWEGPSRKLSEQFAFYANDARMAIVSWPEATSQSAGEALAWGLALASDRDLVLVLPRHLAKPTLQRLPWVSVPVRVFTFTAEQPMAPVAEVIAAKSEVLAEVARWGRRGGNKPVKNLGDRLDWLSELVTWVESRAEIVVAHRQSYLTWHVAGRQILKIETAGPGLVLHAGVQYRDPRPHQPKPPPPMNIDGPLTAEQLRQLEATIEIAVDRRLHGEDTDHEEHRVQHLLLERFRRDGELFGLTQMLREFPAWRPGKRAASVDFLGATANCVPHVVEVKLKHDVMLALQGLDYWIWARANPPQMLDVLGAPATATPVIDLVVGATDEPTAVGPYTLRQLEALDGEIPWRLHIVSEWATDLRTDSLTPRTIIRGSVGAEPAVSPRHSQRLNDHLLAKHRSLLVGDGPFFRKPTSGLVPEAIAAHADLAQRGLLHRFAHHMRSSQMFALNLFAGLEEDARLSLCRLAGVDDVVSAGEVMFEFEDAVDHLGEATSASPHRTQVDAALRCISADRSRTLLLIEVKLSELDFGHCSAYQSAANDRRDVCRTDGPFGNDPNACYQLRNHDRERRRTYDQYLGPTPSTGCGCSFRLTNQSMRNVALGRALMSAGDADRIVHALVAPRSNAVIWRRWQEAKAAIGNLSRVRLADVLADDLFHLYPKERASFLREVYQLGSAGFGEHVTKPSPPRPK